MAQLSATTLKLFQECPRCFWLHVNQKLERPRGPFPSLPGGIDRVLKAYFDAYRSRGILPPLVSRHIPGQLSATALTLGFNDPLGRLWGKLDDCLMLPDGRQAPLDHKTRASAPDDVSYTQQYYQLQMDVYTLLLERGGHKTSRTAYVVYYFPTEGDALHDGFPFGVAVHEVPTNPDQAYEIFQAAARCLAGALPESSVACAYCRWLEARGRVASPSAAAPSAPAAPKISPARQIPEDLFA